MLFVKIITIMLGVCLVHITPCPVDIDVSIDGTKSYYDVQEDSFTWSYEVTATGCTINNDVNWYIAFNHIDPYEYMTSIGQSMIIHKSQTRKGTITLPNPGINVTECDKIAIWGYAECPHHPENIATDLDYTLIRIKPY